MHLNALRIHDFRNYISAEQAFSRGINFIQGDNGQGKTSILEAVYYLCLTKSFKTTEDETAIRFEAPYFDIEGRFADEERSLENEQVRLIVHRGEGKSVLLDKKRLDRFSEYIGRYPAVISAPEDVTIVSGAPGYRRRWMDMALSQLYPVYLKDLQDFRQALKQRNALLAGTYIRPDTLAVWDRELSLTGAKIVRRRLEFIKPFSVGVAQVYTRLAVEAEHAEIRYKSSVADDTVVQEWYAADLSETMIAERIEKCLIANRDRELQRQISLFGPHKDELLLWLNGKPIRDYGSQGQLKTMAIALKLAEFLYVVERLQRKPLLLLDDVFSELDWSRRSHLMEYLENAGQVFVTSADAVPAFEVKNKEMVCYQVTDGTISIKS